MLGFLQVGNVWLNADHINKVEMIVGVDGAVATVKVWMTGGGNYLFLGADAQQFLAFVSKHKIA